MLSRTLMVAATALAISALAAYAQSSSNPTMQPNPGGASKTETPGPKAKAKGAKKTPGPADSSSTPSMAPTTGTGGSPKVEGQGKAAKVKGAKKIRRPATAPARRRWRRQSKVSGCLMHCHPPQQCGGFCLNGASGRGESLAGYKHVALFVRKHLTAFLPRSFTMLVCLTLFAPE